MVLDYGKAREMKRQPSNDSETSESSSNNEKLLSNTKILAKEPLDARLDCDLALITEEVVDGIIHLFIQLFSLQIGLTLVRHGRWACSQSSVRPGMG